MLLRLLGENSGLSLCTHCDSHALPRFRIPNGVAVILYQEMPGPQKTSRFGPHSRKATTGKGKLSALSDVADVPTTWAKRIRVVCTDPDATDSSSSDEEEAVTRKRVVREIIVHVRQSDSIDDSCELSVSKPVAGESTRGKLAKKVKVPAPKKSKGLACSKKMERNWVCGMREPRRDIPQLCQEQPLPSDLSSMCENDVDVIQACSKVESLVNSASSMLQNGVADDSSSFNACLSGEGTISEGFLPDLDCMELSSSGDTALAHSFRSGHGPEIFHPFVKLLDVDGAGALVEEPAFQGDFGKMFDVDIPVTDKTDGALHLLL